MEATPERICVAWALWEPWRIPEVLPSVQHPLARRILEAARECTLNRTEPSPEEIRRRMPEGEKKGAAGLTAQLFDLALDLDADVFETALARLTGKPEVVVTDDTPPDILTDIRVAEYFAGQVKNEVRYWAEIRKWLIYDGRRWTTDAPGGAFPHLKQVIASLYQSAAQLPDSQRENMIKEILRLERHPRQKEILAAASVIPEIIVSSAQLDRNPMALNCLNGTIDLSTGDLHPHRPGNLITRLVDVDYNPGATCPQFLTFLETIFSGDKELIAYLQRFAGYCLTGLTGEQMLLFFYGLGANGKTVLTNIIKALLGDFATTAAADLLMMRDHRTATNDLAALRGSRLVCVSEFDDGERLAEAQIKTMTGGDAVSCRFLYGEFFEYTPTFKIILIGNHKPKIRGTDEGIWRRLHLLPFDITIPEDERDPHLFNKLRRELPGILAWAVRGCLEWQKIGLQPPARVVAEVETYRKSEDIFQCWLDECCAIGQDCEAAPNALLESFRDFSGWRSVTHQRLGRMLSAAGFEKSRGAQRRAWQGIGLISETHHDAYDGLTPNSVKPSTRGNIEKVYRNHRQSDVSDVDEVPL